MRDWIKALPLGLGLPIMIGAASVKPEDAVSNVAAWLHLLGLSIPRSGFLPLVPTNE